MTSIHPQKEAGRFQMGTPREGSFSALSVTSQLAYGWTRLWNRAFGSGAQSFRASRWGGRGGGEYQSLDVCAPPNSYTEILTPKVMVLGREAFVGD